MSKKLEAVAVSGPTTDNNKNLKKFKFKKKDKTMRVGVPSHFDFSWILTSPTTLKSNKPFYFNWEE